MTSVIVGKIAYVEPVSDYVDFNLLRTDQEDEDMDVEQGYSYSSRITSITTPLLEELGSDKGIYMTWPCQWEALMEWPESPSPMSPLHAGRETSCYDESDHKEVRGDVTCGS